MHWSVNLSPRAGSQARTDMEILFKNNLFLISEILAGKI